MDNIEKARKTLERIEKMKSAVDTQLFKTDQEEQFKLNIHVDNSLPHGKFFPYKDKPNEWRATSQTFKAMKKNIFALSDSVEELAEPYTCFGCKTDLDKQFWHFCPFCGERFRQEI